MPNIADLLQRSAGGNGRTGPLSGGPLSGGGLLQRFMSGGPIQSLLGNILGNGTAEGQISGQDTQNQILGNDISRTQGTIWDQPVGGELGQFADLAPQQGGTMAQIATPDQGSTQAWYDNTSQSAADPLGLVPDYAQNTQAPMSHAERQDYRDSLANNGSGTPGNYGVSNFTVGGQNVIFGGNGFDPNGRRLYNQTDLGG